MSQDLIITEAKLRAFAPRCKQPATWAQALEAARQASSINTSKRLGHFMGQVFVETAGFTALEESMAYSPGRLLEVFSNVRDLADARALVARGPQAIANRVYANRMGNGNEASGDGWRYRGGGALQLTGKTNHTQAGTLIGIDLVRQPELNRTLPTAAQVAVKLWCAWGCNPLADGGNLEGITERINGRSKLKMQERGEAAFAAMAIW